MFANVPLTYPHDQCFANFRQYLKIFYAALMSDDIPIHVAEILFFNIEVRMKNLLSHCIALLSEEKSSWILCFEEKSKEFERKTSKIQNYE